MSFPKPSGEYKFEFEFEFESTVKNGRRTCTEIWKKIPPPTIPRPPIKGACLFEGTAGAGKIKA